MPPWSTKLKCSGKGCGKDGCKSLLEITEEDLFRIYGGAYYELISYAGIECPVCGATTCLEDTEVEIPKGMTDDLPNYYNWKNKQGK